MMRLFSVAGLVAIGLLLCSAASAVVVVDIGYIDESIGLWAFIPLSLPDDAQSSYVSLADIYSIRVDMPIAYQPGEIWTA